MRKRGLLEQRITTLFVSFDLVGATAYKTLHKGIWAADISAIMKRVIQPFTDKASEGYRFWKTLGDEVVFTKNIPYVFEVQDILNEIYQEVVCINRDIATGKVGGSITSRELSIKAAVWIAEISSNNDLVDNFYTEYQINENQLQPDYLGTDIDTGFRIAKYTSSNRVLISFELAALFFKDSLLKRNAHKIHFLGMRSLKGIWENKAYPIFMYHGDDEISFDASIANAPNTQTDILREYLAQKGHRIVEAPYVQFEEQLIAGLCKDTDLNNNIERLIASVRKKNFYSVSVSAARLRVHYSVLCCAVEEDGIRFIVTKDKQGQWGLGGAVMNHDLHYLDTIQLYYQEEFGVDLDFINDTRYHDPVPLILTTYHMDDFGEERKGSVLLAKISSEKFWGDLSEEYEAQLLKYEELEGFSFFDCADCKSKIFDRGIEHIKNT